MSIRTPELHKGTKVSHWPTRERGEIVGALPAGYSDWLYIFRPDDAPSVLRYCSLAHLATFDNVHQLAAFRPSPPRPEPFQPGPDGGRAA